MSTQVNERYVKALFSEDSLKRRPYDGTWAKGILGNAFQAQALRPLAWYYTGPLQPVGI